MVGTLKSDAVLANADLPYVYKNLLPDGPQSMTTRNGWLANDSPAR